MSYLFDHLDSIEGLLKRPPFGLITDVDGTISQTAPTPKQAEVSPLCREYLSALSRRLALVAAISGRPAAEARNMVGVEGMVYIGNHGLERLTKGQTELNEQARDYPEIIKAVIGELSRLLSIDGLFIEDKGVTASIHYRLCPEPEMARRAILDTLRKIPQARKLHVMQEKKVIDILPQLEVNKGTAVRDLVQGYDLHSGIYLGDDLTDIDAFRAIRSLSKNGDFKGFAIGVINPEMPEGLAGETDFTLNGVADVESFLKWMSQTSALPD